MLNRTTGNLKSKPQTKFHMSGLTCEMGGVPKIRIPFWDPHNKNYRILGGNCQINNEELCPEAPRQQDTTTVTLRKAINSTPLNPKPSTFYTCKP